MNDNAVTDYGWTSAETPGSCDYLAPQVLQLLKGLDVRRVLDLGSGNGQLCKRLAHAGYDTVGVELDAGGVQVARRSFPELRFHNYGVQHDPHLLLAAEFDKPFDAVVSTEVIEHLFSPHLLPAYANRVLRKDGHLILTTPYHGYLKNLTLSVFNHWDRHHSPLWHGGHIKFWSRQTLGRLLEENGFRVTDFRGAGRLPYLWKSMIITARKVS
ncbi:MAG: class I SAM-dependent methyltransferase [Gammaproteobacteria bacterium]